MIRDDLVKRNKMIETYFGSNLGIMIHYRMMNLPQGLGYKVHQNIWEDVAWVQTDECEHVSKEEKKTWKLDHVPVKRF